VNIASARRALAVLGLTFLVSNSGAAEDAVAQTEAYLHELKTLSAGFLQVVRDRDGQITDRVTGSLYLSRPDRFRWEYRDPYEQIIVADGSRLWLYDADLEQVTVRPLESGLGSTPAMLLSGSGRVGDGFLSVGVQEDGTLTWCSLRPKDPGTDFDFVRLAFTTDGRLAAMWLEDKLGQSTEIAFSDVARNPELDPALFRFTPPPGADVIGGERP
jgi:outer membrane lipoprotein carrier protein